MPSQTFYNLPKEKQDKLIKSAILEFERVPFNEASINNIIECANISRGSFYMYFNDKDDLFKYLLKFHKEKFENAFKKILIDNKGDLKETYINLFSEIYDYIHINSNYNFFKNVFVSINTKNQGYIVPNKTNCVWLDEIINLVDKKSLNISQKDEFYDIFDILMHIMGPTIIQSLSSDISKTDLISKYEKKINLVFNGIYRRDD